MTPRGCATFDVNNKSVDIQNAIFAGGHRNKKGGNSIDTDSVKLKLSGQRVDPRTLPENLVMTITHVFREMKDDPFAILATWAYIFCGLTVNDITKLVLLSDKSGTRTASREYIRQKVIMMFQKIKTQYQDEYGPGSVSPMGDRNMEPITVVGIGPRYTHMLEENNDDEENTEEEISPKGPPCAPQDKTTTKGKRRKSPAA